MTKKLLTGWKKGHRYFTPAELKRSYVGKDTTYAQYRYVLELERKRKIRASQRRKTRRIRRRPSYGIYLPRSRF